jgi:ATP-binding cassette subfamily B protein
VSFSYTPDHPLIEGLDLQVEPGQRIAIVGPTGCGKTTIINLLMRFYEVDAGSIRVDGHDIRDVRRSSLRENWGMVLQDTWVKSGTVAENIALGRPGATREEIERAGPRRLCRRLRQEAAPWLRHDARGGRRRSSPQARGSSSASPA